MVFCTEHPDTAKTNLTALLARLARLSVSHPWAVLIATTVPCLVATVLIIWVPFDLSFTGVLDRKDPRVDAYFELAEELNFAGRMPLLIEGPEEVLDEAALATVALEELPQVDRVFAELPEDWLRQEAPWLVEREVFDAWVGLASGGDPQALRGLLDEQVQPVQGARLVLVMLRDDPVDAELGEVGFSAIQEATDELLAPFEVTHGYGGIAAVVDQDQTRTLSRVQIITPLSLLIVLALLSWVERRPLHLLAVAAPMVLASGATLGIVGTLTGKITFMETFYGVMIFGLGVDFALHLMVRTREELAERGDLAEAVEAA